VHSLVSNVRNESFVWLPFDALHRSGGTCSNLVSWWISHS